jgi:hypothetical protein
MAAGAKVQKYTVIESLVIPLDKGRGQKRIREREREMKE